MSETEFIMTERGTRPENVGKCPKCGGSNVVCTEDKLARGSYGHLQEALPGSRYRRYRCLDACNHRWSGTFV